MSAYRHTHGSSFIRSLFAGLLFHLLELLDLVGGWFLELKVDLMGSQSLVAVGHGVNFVRNKVFVEWVEEDSLALTLVEADSDRASSDGRWSHNVVKEGILDSLEGS